MTANCFYSLIVVVVGSGIDEKSGSGINIPDPQQWFKYS
jgi:hypothetical protein